MNMWRYYILILAAAVLLLSSGCGNREPQRKPAEPPLEIGFALADINRDGNKTIKKTVDEHKKRENVNITWLDAKNDPAEQQNQLNELIEKKVKAVVLQPVDPMQAPAQVERLAQAGIKVVALENLPLNTPVDAYIASDHAMVGRLQARYVIETLRRAEEIRNGQAAPPRAGTIIREENEQGGEQQQQGGAQGRQGQQEQQGQQGGQGHQVGAQQQAAGAVDYNVAAQLPEKSPLNVVIMRGDPRDQQAVAITEACREALRGRDDINILGVYDHPRLDTAMVPATLGQILARGERVDVILANDSSLAMAAVDYLKAGGYERNVLTVGVGADERSSRALVNGEHDAEVDVNPEMLGQFALEAARDLAQNGAWQYGNRAENGDYGVPTRIVPVRLVTAKNAYLLEDRWKNLKQQGQQQEQQGQGGGNQEQQQSGEEQQGQSQGGGQGQQGQDKTMLRITTQDGKTVEVEIEGEIKKIESQGGGGQGDQDQPGGGQGGGQGGQ